ncbi:MAG: hypothetical protein L3J41_08550 [Melioribacteraceae bacterium]|nr:hypothetical protein [Melioribacteraceae bacterium]
MEASIEEIEKVVTQLPKEQFRKFRDWFYKFDSEIWDKQIENDLNDGKLDFLVKEAISEYKVGKSKRL